MGHGGLEHKLVTGRAELEISWAVVPSAWGRGVATSIGRRSLALAASLGARRAVAFTRIDNGPSLRVIQRLGMAREREFEHTGLPHILCASDPTRRELT